VPYVETDTRNQTPMGSAPLGKPFLTSYLLWCIFANKLLLIQSPRSGHPAWSSAVETLLCAEIL
jgi:hypothetical protein